MSIFDIFKKLDEEKAAKASQPIEWIVVGLGNPGAKYDNTRHNAGFRALEGYCARSGQKIDRMKFKALAGEGMLGGKRVLFLKPQTFMNLSGESIREAVDFYKIDPETELIVIYDDISLAPGNLRIRKKGSAGGHNGRKNIILHLGTQVFSRIRVGVGEKPAGWDLADYVLGGFSKEDEALVKEACEHAAEAAAEILTDGPDKAMNDFN